MLDTALEFITKQSPSLAVLSAALSFAALIFSSVTTVRMVNVCKALMKSLFQEEKSLKTDLSDINDRELRRIVNYLAHFDKNDVKVERISRNNTDDEFIVFVKAFEGMDDNYKSDFLRCINSETSFNRARALRNLIVHSQFYDRPFEFLVFPRHANANELRRSPAALVDAAEDH